MCDVMIELMIGGAGAIHPKRNNNKTMKTYEIIEEIDRNKKTMDDIYKAIREIRELKTRRDVRAYYKNLPRELQESPLVLMEVRRKRKEIRWVRFYKRWFLR